ncbi:unnamed protein product [Diatraea saccharalis]|uniref:HTH psq-type domain-containing protein n=1 Tax=Diatraea saccharalis TaxID=40085 RepID=A0A9N9WJK4_9NEOP|nr:unnamed protein product [Diatraea saccharalis]
MPRKYKRKEGVRARVCTWTTENLQSAFEEIDKKNLGINEISRRFGIPSRTLRRRYAARSTTKLTMDTTFLISDTALGSENPGTSRAPEVIGLTSTSQPTIQPDVSNVENIEFRESIAINHHQNKTPPNPTPIDRESPSLLIESEILEDISIVDIGDATIEEILRSYDIEQETPSKILIEASPIPKIPLTMAKRAKQSANILNSEENISRKKGMSEKKEKQIKTKLDKKNKTETTKVFKKTQKRTTRLPERQSNKNKKIKLNKTNPFSESDNDKLADLCDKENDNYLKLCKNRASQRRHIIYSSSSENEENRPNHKIKGKITKCLPIKKTKKDAQDNPKDTGKDNCIECFENYKNTKSLSDWIQCVMCQNWLHETCTLYKNYCSRCGKLKALSG